MAATTDLLRMRELSESSGVPAATIKHYLREGLLPKPIKTSRNMAYYPPEFVDRLQLIKRLQEERFMPLKEIKKLLSEDPETITARLEFEDRLLERTLTIKQSESMTRAQVIKHFKIEAAVLDAFEKIGVLTPDHSTGKSTYGRVDLQLLDAIARFRESGYERSVGVGAYEGLIYMRHLSALAEEEVTVMVKRLKGKLEPGQVAELIEHGAEPLRDFVSALHAKLIVAELRKLDPHD